MAVFGPAGSSLKCVAGWCEQDSAVTCMGREVWKEAGQVIAPADVELLHVVHVVDTPGGQPLADDFRARRWKGAPERRDRHRSPSASQRGAPSTT